MVLRKYLLCKGIIHLKLKIKKPMYIEPPLLKQKLEHQTSMCWLLFKIKLDQHIIKIFK